MLRFGLIGCGTHARWAVIPAIESAQEAELRAVADIVPANLEFVKDENVNQYHSYEEMLAAEADSLDAAYICTPCDMHCKATVAALDAGLHVVTEKPMAMTVDECGSMIEAAERNHRQIAVDFELRFSPHWRQAREWVAEGRVGQVRDITIHGMWSGHKAFGDLAARRASFLNSNGCLDCGIHLLDLARFISGAGDWRSVEAMGAWFGESVRFAPHISILAELDPGIVVTMSESFAFTAYIEAAHAWHAFAVVGEKGVIVQEANEAGDEVLHLVCESGEESFCLDNSGGKPISEVLDAFDGVIKGQPNPSIATAHDGLMAQIVMDQANQAALDHGDVCARG